MLHGVHVWDEQFIKVLIPVFQMVYAYKRKTYRCSWSTQSMEQAIRGVNHEGVGVREAARRFEIPRGTLQRHLRTGDSAS